MNKIDVVVILSVINTIVMYMVARKLIDLDNSVRGIDDIAFLAEEQSFGDPDYLGEPEQYEDLQKAVGTKRGRGRPAGSKNKPKQ